MGFLLKHAYLVTVSDRYKRAKRGSEMSDPAVIDDGAFVVDRDVIVEVGKTKDISLKYSESEFEEVIDAEGRAVLPGFVDPHTHAVFVGSREEEFAMRLAGKSYMEILKAGGGILKSVQAVRSASEEELLKALKDRIRTFIEWGTTTVEVKSGYGLTVEDEIKQLEVVKRCSSECVLDLVPTFLGAHAIPPEYRGKEDEYVSLVVEEMLPAVKERDLADFCDVFCEEGVFSVQQSRRILKRAAEYGFKLKLHADEIEPIGGAELAAEVGAVSADHLLKASERGLSMMAQKGVIAVLLPGTAFSLKSQYAAARNMIEKGMAVAIATDCNPGSSYTESMPMIIALSCLGMDMTPDEAIVAATLNAAYAIGMGERLGSIDSGKQADFIILKEKSHLFIPYHYGVNPVKAVFKKGKKIWEV